MNVNLLNVHPLLATVIVLAAIVVAALFANFVVMALLLRGLNRVLGLHDLRSRSGTAASRLH